MQLNNRNLKKSSFEIVLAKLIQYKGNTKLALIL